MHSAMTEFTGDGPGVFAERNVKNPPPSYFPTSISPSNGQPSHLKNAGIARLARPQIRRLTLYDRTGKNELPETRMDAGATLRAAKAGDRVAFEKLIEHTRDPMIRFVVRRFPVAMRGRGAASDIYQDACLTVWRKFLEDFRGESIEVFHAWLNEILRTTIADFCDANLRKKRDIRKEQNWDSLLEFTATTGRGTGRVPSASEPARRKEDGDRLSAALDTLPEFQRKAVAMRYLDGLTCEEIANQLNRSADAVAGYLKRGLQTLRKQLAVSLDQ